jgi:hypothetical protein
MTSEDTTPSEPLVLELEGGGTFTVVDTDGDLVVLSSTRALPPGAPARAHVAGDAATWVVKVRGSRAEGSGFRVEGRFVNLTRAQRERALRAKPSTR